MTPAQLQHIRFCKNAADMIAIRDDDSIRLALLRFPFSSYSQSFIQTLKLEDKSGSKKLATFDYDQNTQYYTAFDPPRIIKGHEGLAFFTECAAIADIFAKATGKSHVTGELIHTNSVTPQSAHIDQEDFIGYMPLRGHGAYHLYPKSIRSEEGASVPLNYLAIWTGTQGPTKLQGPSSHTLHPPGRLPSQNLYLRFK